MLDRSSKKDDQDINALAAQIVEEATGEESEQNSIDFRPEEKSRGENKNPHAQALGWLGGLKGGKARSSKPTPERRQEIPRLAANAHWKKNDWFPRALILLHLA